MAITVIPIANVGSPAGDPTCILPGTLYVPDIAVHPQPWHAFVGTIANTFTGSGQLQSLVPIFTDLANAGYICLAHYVRLIIPIPTQTTDGKYRQQQDDIKIGVRFMRADPGGFGYEVSGKVITLSGSAGAYTALWAALEGTDGDDKADAAVLMSPVTDMGDRSGSGQGFQHFVDVCVRYGRTADPATLTSESPISLTLSAAKPIIHFNGDMENMPVSQIQRFSLAMQTAGALNYSSIINTGPLGRIHSVAMWPDIKAQVLAWLPTFFPPTGGGEPPPPPEPTPGTDHVVLRVPLSSGTLLANVVYRWVVQGIGGVELSDGITQPIADFPEFRFDIEMPSGAEELIVYDKTDIGNWNKVEAPSRDVFFTPPPEFATPAGITRIRTTPFHKVIDCVLRRRGLNPKSKIPSDVRTSIVEHINTRVEQITLAWPWPEWTNTEERAFRQVWSPMKQYFVRNAVGKSDEVFLIDTMSYWKVDPEAASDPAPGLLPNDPDNSGDSVWLPMTTVEPYIEYDQPCKRSIGEMLGVYQTNPATTFCNNGSLLSYRPGPNGIQIQNASGPTVFIKYKYPIPHYTIEPFIRGRTYNRGDVILDIISGECFQAVGTTTLDPLGDTAAWQFIPFLQKWMQFCCWGAFADTLSEIDQGGVFDPNMEAMKQANAEQKAMEALQQQVDSFLMQGERLIWNYWGRSGQWRETLPWTGETVTTLTDVCESSVGWVYPFVS